jgi:hypothetical protein
MSIMGICAFVVIPYSFIYDTGDSTGGFILMLILTSSILGCVLTIQFALPRVSQFLVHIYCKCHSIISRSTAGSEKLKPIILKNLKTNKQRNIKTGSMFITAIMYYMFLDKLTIQIKSMVMSSLSGIVGADFTVL